MASTFRLRPRYRLGRTWQVDGCIKPNFSDSRKGAFQSSPFGLLGLFLLRLGRGLREELVDGVRRHDVRPVLSGDLHVAVAAALHDIAEVFATIEHALQDNTLTEKIEGESKND